MSSRLNPPTRAVKTGGGKLETLLRGASPSQPMIGDTPNEPVSLAQRQTSTGVLNMANCKHRRIKRPMNAFLVYARTHRPILSKTCPNATAAEITLKLGIEWRKLSDEQKVPYFAESLRLKWEHQQQFPDWEYNPRPRKKKRVNPEVAPPKPTSCTSPAIAQTLTQSSVSHDIPVASLNNSTSNNSTVKITLMLSSSACLDQQVPIFPGGSLFASPPAAPMSRMPGPSFPGTSALDSPDTFVLDDDDISALDNYLSTTKTHNTDTYLLSCLPVLDKQALEDVLKSLPQGLET